jgi:hypothetical protein
VFGEEGEEWECGREEAVEESERFGKSEVLGVVGSYEARSLTNMAWMDI